jgi:hypothetical protein
MNRKLALLAALALPMFTGCDQAEETSPAVAEMQAALPSSETMRIDMPSGNFQVAQQATFYGFTWGMTTNINGFVRDISNVIEDIVELPPTVTDNETFAVWGPWTEPLSPATWQVRVDRGADGMFTYAVEAWPRGETEDAAVTVLSGTHTPREGVRQGVGSWSFNLSAAHSLDPIAHDSIGTVDVAYDLAEARALEVTFTDVQGPHDPQTNSTLYRYTQAADRSGTFDFISNLDIHADDDPQLDRREVLQVRARWLAEGPGRADVLATHGDLPEGIVADLVECWGEAFTQSYMSLSWGAHHQESGDAGACAYGDRQLPMFEGFDANAFSDADLIAAMPQPGEFELEAAPVSDEVAEPAVYYQIAKGSIEQLSAHTRGVLNIVGSITRNPPSTCAEDACQWGPWTDWDTRISYKLLAARVEEGLVGYQLDMRAFGEAGDWATVLEGGYAEANAEAGQGRFAINYDVSADLSDTEELRGVFRADYMRDGAQGAINARFEQLSWQGNTPVDAQYFFAWSAEGGVVNAAFPADVDDNDSEPEQLEMRVRYIPNGTGVGDVIVSGGDIPANTQGLGVQCWDEHAAATHYHAIARTVGEATLPNTDGPGCVVTDWQDPEFPAMSHENDAG